MSFSHVSNLLEKNFNDALSQYGTLFTVDLDKDALWDLYLSSFPEGTNPIYRTNTVHDCSCCRHFIKNIGPTVWIDGDLNLHTIFGFDAGETAPIYQPVMDALDAFVKRHHINGIYLSKESKVGSRATHAYEDGESVEYHHFYVALPRYMVTNRIGETRGSFISTVEVFMRSLKEISLEAVDTVHELILSNTLYRGEEWKGAIEKFRAYKVFYDGIIDGQRKELFCWKFSAEAGNVVGKIRNHSIGVLLTDVTNGVDLEQAVKSYERIVAPANYKRPKAIFTKKMLEDAQKKVEELGYMDSLPRRYATLDDISVGNILFANRDARKKLAGNVFDAMMEEATVNPRKFSKVEEIPIDKFIADVLPTAKEVDVLMQPRHEKNLCSVIAPVNPDSKTMFKWNNGFSWAYSGNMADSDIRQNVAKAGGDVSGVLRFSIQWNDLNGYDGNDEDAHCIEPRHNEIFYGAKYNSRTLGNLDVDIIHPAPGKPAVENITWPSLEAMDDGTYQFFVHCYCNRGGTSGFRAEIEFDGEIFHFDYPTPLRTGERVYVADVTLNNGQFTIKERLNGDSSMYSRTAWGVKENTFVPVSVIMYSPNYWDQQNGIGNRHYMFMMNGCVNPETPNGFYNEYLRNELLEHKRVFEALGARMKVQDTENQLSGLGFSSTQRNELIVRVKGNIQRIMKIKF